LQPEVFALDESELAERVEADLRELLGINEAPLFVETAKWERSMPQYEVGHLDRVNEIEKLVSKLPDLTLAGNSYRGAGIPDCIRSGEAAAESMVTFLNSAPTPR
jgi:oxygen-dependent protoporphyrinogen oxidase